MTSLPAGSKTYFGNLQRSHHSSSSKTFKTDAKPPTRTASRNNILPKTTTDQVGMQQVFHCHRISLPYHRPDQTPTWCSGAHLTAGEYCLLVICLYVHTYGARHVHNCAWLRCCAVSVQYIPVVVPPVPHAQSSHRPSSVGNPDHTGYLRTYYIQVRIRKGELAAYYAVFTYVYPICQCFYLYPPVFC